MFLKTLALVRDESVIREVHFRRGLNLILDETGGSQTDSGNDVGKTTLLRAVNYCLGGSIKPIYVDPEFPEQVNEKVYNFVTSGLVFRLTLESIDGTVHVIERAHGQSITIDGEPHKKEEFRSRLNELLFGISGARPTARQLLAKYIRITAHEVSNTVRFLHTSQRYQEYDAVFLYLFGFPNIELLQKRHGVAHEVNQLSKRLKQMKKVLSAESRTQVVNVLDSEIEQLEKALEEFDVGEGVERELRRLEEIRNRVSDLSRQVSEMSTRVSLMQATLSELDESVSKIDLEVLRDVYQSAELLVPDTHRSFEELVKFHNAMINSKRGFVEKQLAVTVKRLDKARQKLEDWTTEEQDVLQEVERKGAMVDLAKLQRELDRLYEQRGRETGILNAQLELRQELTEKEEELAQLSDEISQIAAVVGENERIFNRYFASFSKKLYGEAFVFALEFRPENDAMVRPTIASLSKNEGAGKKRAQVSAFDLAYLAFAADTRPTTPRFTLHDRVEDVDSHQLGTLFEIADSIDGQYVVAVLREKAEMASNYVDECEILSLSQTDKFLRIEAID